MGSGWPGFTARERLGEGMIDFLVSWDPRENPRAVHLAGSVKVGAMHAGAGSKTKCGRSMIGHTWEWMTVQGTLHNLTCEDCRVIAAAVILETSPDQ